MSKPSSAGLETLLSAREGDHEAGRILVGEHGPSMVRTAWRVLGRYGAREAEDVVQEALVAALTTNALPSGDVGAWLRSIAARKALDWLRMRKRRGEQPLPEPEGSGTDLRAAGNPEAGVQVLAARKALSFLGAKDRAVLVLADLEGRSMAEVAEILGSTRAAVKLRASRARRKLARLLAGPGEGERKEGRE